MNRRNDGRQQPKLYCLVSFSAILLFLLASLSEQAIAWQANGEQPLSSIYIQDAQPIAVTHLGASQAIQALDSGQARPLSLARGDFNQDGIEDLVAGYAAPDGTGFLVLHPGNVDAFAPRTEGAWQAIAHQQFPSPFLSIAATLQLPSSPDFLATGNFAGSDHVDVLTAARGGNTLYLLAGDGQGNFSPPQPLTLPGMVSAMAAGRFGAGNLRSTVIVGLSGSKPGVLLYSGSNLGWQPAGWYPLPAPPTAFFTDDMDGDGLPDVVMIADGRVVILHAAGSSGRPELETLSLPLSPVAIITGTFVHDRGWRRQIAVLDQAGTVNIIVHGGFDSRGWTKAEIKAMRDALLQRRPNPFARTQSGPVRDGWKIIETIPGMAPSGGSGHPLLLSSRISGGVTDDVLVIDAGAAQMAMANHARVHIAASSFTPASLAARAFVAGSPVAALSFPVNVDAREGLVLLLQNQTAISVMMPVPAPRPAAVAQPTASSGISGAGRVDIPAINSSNAH